MKTKTKTIALVEIAIMLCSVFLVALPGIAADQTTQEVSIAEVTTASEDDFILEIYGNANEDECIDMRDYTYTARIICWLEDETDLADANYDGRISVADMTQIGLIILGRESELTIVDSAGISKTFYKPMERIIVLSDGDAELVKVLGAEDLVVGVGYEVTFFDILLPEMSKLPSVGGYILDIDYEKVLSLEPDLFLGGGGGPVELDEEKLELAGVQVLGLGTHKPKDIIQSTRKLGYLLGKVDNAEEFVTFHEGVLDELKAQTEGLSEDEKPRVFIEYCLYGDYWTCSAGTKGDTLCTIAGGINIAHDIISEGFPGYPVVDSEWVLKENPDFVVRPTFGGDWGYTADEIQKQEWETEMEAVREETMKRPGWEKIAAVEDGDVYIVSGDIAQSGLFGFVYATYMAKWFHPELFEDLDPDAIHQEFVDRFMRVDYDVKKGVFVYPPLED